MAALSPLSVRWIEDAVSPPKQFTISGLARGTVVTFLLLGSLYPAPGVPWVLVAAIVAAPLVLFTLAQGLLRKPHALHRAVPFAAMLGVIVGTSAIFNPPGTEYGHTKTQTFLTLTLFTMTAAMLIRDRRDLTSWAIVWVISGIFLAVLALTGSVSAQGRAVGDGDLSPIWLARAIGSPGIAVLWLAYQRVVPRWAAAVVGALLTYAVFATGSRGPLIGLILGAGIVMICAGGSNQAVRLTTIATLAAVGGYIAVAFQLIPTDSRVGDLIFNASGDVSAQQRARLISPTVDLIFQYPGGIGIGNFRQYVAIGTHIYPHNLWLEMLCEMGWLLGGALIAIVVTVVVRTWRAAEAGPEGSLMLGLLVFEVSCVTVSGDLNARTFFFVLTMAYLVHRWTRTVTEPRSTATAPTLPVQVAGPGERSGRYLRSRTGSSNRARC